MQRFLYFFPCQRILHWHYFPGNKNILSLYYTIYYSLPYPFSNTFLTLIVTRCIN